MSLPATTKNIPNKYAGTWDDQDRDNRSRPGMTLGRKNLKWVQNQRKSKRQVWVTKDRSRSVWAGPGERKHVFLLCK